MKKSLWVLAAGFLATAIFAQTKPDFSGTWKLDSARSRFNGAHEPSSLVLTIEHHEPKLLIATVSSGKDGETHTSLELTTDGAPHEQVIGGQSVTATARWDTWEGKRLVWQVDQQTPDGVVSVTRRATLGEKDKILTTILTIKDKGGERTAYEFFVRQ